MTTALPACLSARYRARSLLGSGGMGRVVLAEDLELGRKVAIKIAHPGMAESERARMVREARAMAGVSHPALVRIFDQGESPEGPWLVMDYLEGVTLDRLPSDRDPLEPMLQVASALQCLHDAGLLHRDLKPPNILWTPAGQAVLLDLGLVQVPDRTRLTREGMLVGTMPFMAPEVLLGEPFSRASDWYAWGVTWYWLEERRLPVQPDEILVHLSTDSWPEPAFSRLAPESRRASALRSLLGAQAAGRPRDLVAIRTLVADLLAAPAPGATPTPDTPAPLVTPDPGAAAALPTPAEPGRPSRATGLAAVAALAAFLLALTAIRPGSRHDPDPIPGMVPEGAGFRRTRDGARMLRVEAGDGRFLLDRTEIPVAGYRKWIETTGRAPPFLWETQRSRPSHPVVFVTAEDAAAYCADHGVRLPTRSEALRARGLDPASADVPRRSPEHAWSSREPGTEPGPATFADRLVPVEAAGGGSGPDDLVGLAGNVAEWTGTPVPSGRIVAAFGGSWRTSGELRPPGPTAGQDGATGFRCAADLPASATLDTR